MTQIRCLQVAGYAVTALLLLALAGAPDSSDAGTSARSGRVVIECQGPWGPEAPRRPARGRCVVSGAITDRGWFVDGDRLRVHPHVRMLKLRKGTIDLSVYREHHGHWKVIAGTEAYTGLRGRGWEALTVAPGRIEVVMRGRVAR